MKIIPVLDLKDGLIVQGIAGRRELYKPIHSVYSDSSRPLDIATALHDAFSTEGFYLADLDAIGGAAPAEDTLKELTAAGFQIDVDAGATEVSELATLLEAGAHRAIIALETLTFPLFLREAVESFGPERIVFSLDLRNGTPVSACEDWQDAPPLDITAAVWGAGIRQMIVLDISSVGTGSGLATRLLCQDIVERFPGLDLISGGGIRTEQEIEELADEQFLSGLLVASLIHQGKLSPALVHRLNAGT
ncbi:MAG: hypothetical protein CMJ46_15650 [Planctomyces sp.]|nr:hypothetical protein [Planctomyces sp.]